MADDVTPPDDVTPDQPEVPEPADAGDYPRQTPPPFAPFNSQEAMLEMLGRLGWNGPFAAGPIRPNTGVRDAMRQGKLWTPEDKKDTPPRAPRAWVDASLPERASQIAHGFEALHNAGMPDDEAGCLLRMLVSFEHHEASR